MYRVYREKQMVASICCDNDNIKVIPIERVYPATKFDESLEDCVGAMARAVGVVPIKVRRKHSWAFVEDKGDHLESCLWVYEHKTQFWDIDNVIHVFEIC